MKVPAGDFRDRVTVHETTSSPRRGGGTEKTFTPIGPPLWMKVETLATSTHDFNGVNVEELPTHRFTARWRADITAENFLEFNGARFEILEIEDPESRREYLVMKCRQTGAVDREAARA
ncbi:MAG: phage head closure protein [Rhizobiales bacterium]|nr:phage head closure protein [Hyphomicrobiales bacterium]